MCVTSPLAQAMCHEMMLADLEEARKLALLKQHAFDVVRQTE